MFSKHLEDLIQATLQDGILEDYEKEALLKAAKAEGVDPNELQIYINSILQKRSQENKAKKDREDMILERERIAAKGKVCPNCGRQVPPLTLKCVCGYEFTDQKSASSVKELSDKINALRAKDLNVDGGFLGLDKTRNEEKAKAKREEDIRELIHMYPVPNTKEDIIEFLAMAAPNSQKKGGILGSIGGRTITLLLTLVILSAICYLVIPNGIAVDVTIGVILFLALCLGPLVISNVDKDTLKWNKDAVVWRAKFKQVLMKGRSLQGDPDFQRQLDYYENVVNEK